MSSKIVCNQCEYVGAPKTAVKGSGGVELILWLFFIVPGLIYSIWRSSSRYPVCPKCGSDNLVPLDSPKARKIMGENMSSEEIENKIKTEEEKDSVAKKKTMKMILIGIAIFVGLIILINLIGNSY